MSTTTTADDMRTLVLNYNAEWVRTDSTAADRVEMLDALLRGQATRTIVVSPVDRFGREYRIAVTDGIVHEDSHYPAEDPRTYRLRRRDGREDMGRVAERVYGRDRPEGMAVRVIRHH